MQTIEITYRHWPSANRVAIDDQIVRLQAELAAARKQLQDAQELLGFWEANCELETVEGEVN